MSPEQIRAEPDLDHRTDVYSIGVILYEVLTHHFLFDEKRLTTLLRMVQDDPPIPPRERAPERTIPRLLASICLKCLEKDPADRYPTIRAVIDALQAWIQPEDEE